MTTAALQRLWCLSLFLNGSDNMSEEKKTTVKKTESEKKPLKEEHFETKKDWAEAAYQELADYIEEQGIYIRY